MGSITELIIGLMLIEFVICFTAAVWYGDYKKKQGKAEVIQKYNEKIDEISMKLKLYEDYLVKRSKGE